MKEGEEVSFKDILTIDSKAQLYHDLNNKFLAEIIEKNGFSTREKAILKFFKEGLTTREIGKRIKVSHVSIVKVMHKIRVKCRRYQE